MKKIFLLIAVATLALTFNSCSKSSPGTSKVQYKLVGSAGVQISSVAYATDGTGGANTITEVGTQTWESEEYTFDNNKGYATMSASATGPDNNATLKAQIFVNGQLKKESSATGTILATSVSAAE